MSLFQLKTNLFGAAVGAATAAVAVGHYLWARRQPRVQKLVIYPFKSLPGIHVDELEITNIGVKYGPFIDRSFLILNENNNLVSQRIKPKLTLIRTSLVGNCIVLEADGLETLKIDVTEDLSKNEQIEFQLWNQPTSGVICGEAINKWMSDFLEMPVKVVRFIDEMHQFRSSKVQKKNETAFSLNPEIPIRYQDGDPVFLINSASVAAFNTVLERPFQVTYMNFRPNIYANLSTAYEEDNVKLLTIGTITFLNIKLCERCTFTTVNVDTGVKQPEILDALRKYRMLEGYKSPCFGANLTPLQLGSVKLGDAIEINELK